MRRVRAVTIRDGVDSTRFCPDRLAGRRFVRSYGIAGPFLLAVGALSDEQGFEFLFRSLQTLASEPPQLVICGDGGDRFRLQNLAADHDLDVTILGPIPLADMAGAYNACVALVHVGDVETSGLTAIKAMLCARPVVAVAVGALPEVLGDDGACGLLVSPNAERAMATAIDRVLGDPAFAATMGRRGRERAVKSFPLESMAEAYAGVVRRHLGSARGAFA
jgi:starch synthase